jgi:hypothetical protein
MITISALISALCAAAPAVAAQPRPWLCRIKPVFSSQHAMRFAADRSGEGRWRLLLMSFDPMGGHDGYTIIESHDLGSSSPNVSGQLSAGRYFAVAQYLEDGEWICPGYAQRSDKYNPAEIASICYGEHDAPDCAVKLTVTPAAPPPGH